MLPSSLPSSLSPKFNFRKKAYQRAFCTLDKSGNLSYDTRKNLTLAKLLLQPSDLLIAAANNNNQQQHQQQGGGGPSTSPSMGPSSASTIDDKEWEFLTVPTIHSLKTELKYGAPKYDLIILYVPSMREYKRQAADLCELAAAILPIVVLVEGALEPSSSQQQQFVHYTQQPQQQQQQTSQLPNVSCVMMATEDPSATDADEGSASPQSVLLSLLTAVARIQQRSSSSANANANKFVNINIGLSEEASATTIKSLCKVLAPMTSSGSGVVLRESTVKGLSKDAAYNVPLWIPPQLPSLNLNLNLPLAGFLSSGGADKSGGPTHALVTDLLWSCVVSAPCWENEGDSHHNNYGNNTASSAGHFIRPNGYDGHTIGRHLWRMAGTSDGTAYLMSQNTSFGSQGMLGDIGGGGGDGISSSGGAATGGGASTTPFRVKLQNFDTLEFRAELAVDASHSDATAMAMSIHNELMDLVASSGAPTSSVSVRNIGNGVFELRVPANTPVQQLLYLLSNMPYTRNSRGGGGGDANDQHAAIIPFTLVAQCFSYQIVGSPLAFCRMERLLREGYTDQQSQLRIEDVIISEQQQQIYQQHHQQNKSGANTPRGGNALSHNNSASPNRNPQQHLLQQSVDITSTTTTNSTTTTTNTVVGAERGREAVLHDLAGDDSPNRRAFGGYSYNNNSHNASALPQSAGGSPTTNTLAAVANSGEGPSPAVGGPMGHYGAQSSLPSPPQRPYGGGTTPNRGGGGGVGGYTQQQPQQHTVPLSAALQSNNSAVTSPATISPATTSPAVPPLSFKSDGNGAIMGAQQTAQLKDWVLQQLERVVAVTNAMQQQQQQRGGSFSTPRGGGNAGTSSGISPEEVDARIQKALLAQQRAFEARMLQQEQEMAATEARYRAELERVAAMSAAQSAAGATTTTTTAPPNQSLAIDAAALLASAEGSGPNANNNKTIQLLSTAQRQWEARLDEVVGLVKRLEARMTTVQQTAAVNEKRIGQLTTQQETLQFQHQQKQQHLESLVRQQLKEQQTTSSKLLSQHVEHLTNIVNASNAAISRTTSGFSVGAITNNNNTNANVSPLEIDGAAIAAPTPSNAVRLLVATEVQKLIHPINVNLATNYHTKEQFQETANDIVNLIPKREAVERLVASRVKASEEETARSIVALNVTMNSVKEELLRQLKTERNEVEVLVETAIATNNNTLTNTISTSVNSIITNALVANPSMSVGSTSAAANGGPTNANYVSNMTFTTTLNALKASIDAVKADVNGVQEAAVGRSSDAATVRTTVDRLTNDVDNLKVRLDTLAAGQSNIAAATAQQISSIQSDVSQRISNAIASVEMSKSSASTHSANPTAANEASIKAAVTEQLAKDVNNLIANAPLLTRLTQRLDNLQQVVSERTEILKTRCDGVEGRVGFLEQSSAALQNDILPRQMNTEQQLLLVQQHQQQQAQLQQQHLAQQQSVVNGSVSPAAGGGGTYRASSVQSTTTAITTVNNTTATHHIMTTPARNNNNDTTGSAIAYPSTYGRGGGGASRPRASSAQTFSNAGVGLDTPLSPGKVISTTGTASQQQNYLTTTPSNPTRYALRNLVELQVGDMRTALNTLTDRFDRKLGNAIHMSEMRHRSYVDGQLGDLKLQMMTQLQQHQQRSGSVGGIGGGVTGGINTSAGSGNVTPRGSILKRSSSPPSAANKVFANDAKMAALSQQMEQLRTTVDILAGQQQQQTSGLTSASVGALVAAGGTTSTAKVEAQLAGLAQRVARLETTDTTTQQLIQHLDLQQQQQQSQLSLEVEKRQMQLQQQQQQQQLYLHQLQIVQQQQLALQQQRDLQFHRSASSMSAAAQQQANAGVVAVSAVNTVATTDATTPENRRWNLVSNTTDLSSANVNNSGALLSPRFEEVEQLRSFCHRHANDIKTLRERVGKLEVVQADLTPLLANEDQHLKALSTMLQRLQRLEQQAGLVNTPRQSVSAPSAAGNGAVGNTTHRGGPSSSSPSTRQPSPIFATNNSRAASRSATSPPRTMRDNREEIQQAYQQAALRR